MNYFKTFLLFVVMGALIIFLGRVIGGTKGMIVAFVVAAIFTFVQYYFSDRIVLAMTGAKEVGPKDYPVYTQTVNNLAAKMDIPVPKMYVITMEAPNAFATGRNPDHAVVAISPSLLDMLNRNELEVVMAHELSHIKHRDMLLTTVAATVVMAITMIARFAEFAAIFGGRSSDDKEGNPFAMLILSMLAMFGAILIQLAISRSREYHADAAAAKITDKPAALISALEKLHSYAKQKPAPETAPATASLFIVNPFKKSFIVSLFSTHPSLENRTKNLEKVAQEIGISL